MNQSSSDTNYVVRVKRKAAVKYQGDQGFWVHHSSLWLVWTGSLAALFEEDHDEPCAQKEKIIKVWAKIGKMLHLGKSLARL